MSCHFAGYRCNLTQEFQRFFDPYYFNCFTYMAWESRERDESLAEGIENGWSSIVLSGSGMLDKNDGIRMLPGLHEWSSAVSASEGVRVVIHPPNTQPYPFTEGYDVPPGFSASFGIRPRINIRIGPPHGNCSQLNPFDATSSRYRLMACQKMCLQHMVVNSCNCSDTGLPHLSEHAHVLPCRDDSHIPRECMNSNSSECLDEMFKVHRKIQCARSKKASITKNASAIEKCGCFPPCDEVSYDVSYSLSKWPASGYEGDAAYYDIFHIVNFVDRFNKNETSGKYKSFQSYFNVSNREETMKDFARLNVYIADSNVVKTQESEDYIFNQLVSDIGGQLGLWVGISVLTIAEMFELMFDVMKLLLRCPARKLPNRTNATRRRDKHGKHAKNDANGHLVMYARQNGRVNAKHRSNPKFLKKKYYNDVCGKDVESSDRLADGETSASDQAPYKHKEQYSAFNTKSSFDYT